MKSLQDNHSHHIFWVEMLHTTCSCVWALSLRIVAWGRFCKGILVAGDTLSELIAPGSIPYCGITFRSRILNLGHLLCDLVLDWLEVCNIGSQSFRSEGWELNWINLWSEMFFRYVIYGNPPFDNVCLNFHVRSQKSLRCLPWSCDLGDYSTI